MKVLIRCWIISKQLSEAFSRSVTIRRPAVSLRLKTATNFGEPLVLFASVLGCTVSNVLLHDGVNSRPGSLVQLLYFLAGLAMLAEVLLLFGVTAKKLISIERTIHNFEIANG
jgi:hypothetical protein